MIQNLEGYLLTAWLRRSSHLTHLNLLRNSSRYKLLRSSLTRVRITDRGLLGRNIDAIHRLLWRRDSLTIPHNINLGSTWSSDIRLLLICITGSSDHLHVLLDSVGIHDHLFSSRCRQSLTGLEAEL